MDAKEFKKLKPEYAELEGEELWNAMEDYMIRQQAGQEVMKTAVPFFKRYQLRWLFYRRLPNMVFSKGDYTSNTRCKICKRGSGMMWFFQGKLLCGSGDHEYIEEPNTSLKHKVYKAWKYISGLFWLMLDKIHLVRSSHHGRYEMFGDESPYISSFTINLDTGKVTYHLKKRKWWEYIFIERR